MPNDSISPRRPKGPPLNALRAFEVVSRCGSISAAADELSVTPGAVAQHVKALEEWAGRPLFKRHARGLYLTDLAHELSPKFQSAFDKLADAVQDLRRAAAPQAVTVAALPAIAQIWLPTKLAKLRELAPELSVSVYAFETAPDLAREPFDISIYFRNGVDEGFQTSLAQDTLFPVACPELAAQIRTKQDFLTNPLISDATWNRDWHNWARYCGVDLPKRLNGPVYSLYSMAMQAALDGAGILLGHGPLVREHIKTGTLVAVSDCVMHLDHHLVAEIAPGHSANPNIERVRSALLAD